MYEDQHRLHKAHGLVADVFTEDVLDTLKGRAAIGHNRYSTTGANEKYNIQPLKANLFNGPVSLAHNGNIINSQLVKHCTKIPHEQHTIGTNKNEIRVKICTNSFESTPRNVQ